MVVPAVPDLLRTPPKKQVVAPSEIPATAKPEQPLSKAPSGPATKVAVKKVAPESVPPLVASRPVKRPAAPSASKITTVKRDTVPTVVGANAKKSSSARPPAKVTTPETTSMSASVPVAEPPKKSAKATAAKSDVRPTAVRKPAARKSSGRQPGTLVPDAAPVEAAAKTSVAPVVPSPMNRPLPPPVPWSERRRPATVPDLPPIPSILLEDDPHTVPTDPALPVFESVKYLASEERPSSGEPPDPVAGAVLAVVRPPSVPTTAVPFPSRGALWLTARDPFCVCAHWELDEEATHAYAAAKGLGCWRLRVWNGPVGGWLVGDQPLPVGVSHRFVPVLLPGTAYVAEIGFLGGDGSWRGLVVSRPMTTPPDGASGEMTVAFATVAREPVTPETLRSAPPDHPVAALMSPSRVVGLSLPDPVDAARLTELVWSEMRRSAPGNSGDIARLVSAQVVRSSLIPVGEPMPDAGASDGHDCGNDACGLPSSAAVASSAPEKPRGFWFKVNAEVVLHGSTERDARVTIGGRPVKLREDGSFSFRFALPDGEFRLPVIAVDATGTDGRSAIVTFSRSTSLGGDVGIEPIEPALRPPTPEAIV